MKRHTAEEIIPKLRQAEADLAQGLTIAHPRSGRRRKPPKRKGVWCGGCWSWYGSIHVGATDVGLMDELEVRLPKEFAGHLRADCLDSF